jgi:hypothetical protein
VAPRRVALYVASLAVQTWLATFLDNPGRVIAGAYLIEVIALLLLIEIMYRVYHATDSERTRDRLRSLVTSPAHAGMGGPIGTASLFGCLFVVIAFFWPFTVYAWDALKHEAGWVIAISAALTTTQLLRGGIVMDFAHSKEISFGYNLKWMFAILFMIVLGVVVMLAASLANVFDLIPKGRGERVAEILIACIVLFSLHLTDFLTHAEARSAALPRGAGPNGN